MIKSSPVERLLKRVYSNFSKILYFSCPQQLQIEFPCSGILSALPHESADHFPTRFQFLYISSFRLKWNRPSTQAHSPILAFVLIPQLDIHLCQKCSFQKKIAARNVTGWLQSYSQHGSIGSHYFSLPNSS